MVEITTGNNGPNSSNGPVNPNNPYNGTTLPPVPPGEGPKSQTQSAPNSQTKTTPNAPNKPAPKAPSKTTPIKKSKARYKGRLNSQSFTAKSKSSRVRSKTSAQSQRPGLLYRINSRGPRFEAWKERQTRINEAHNRMNIASANMRRNAEAVRKQNSEYYSRKKLENAQRFKQQKANFSGPALGGIGGNNGKNRPNKPVDLKRASINNLAQKKAAARQTHAHKANSLGKNAIKRPSTMPVRYNPPSKKFNTVKKTTVKPPAKKTTTPVKSSIKRPSTMPVRYNPPSKKFNTVKKTTVKPQAKKTTTPVKTKKNTAWQTKTHLKAKASKNKSSIANKSTNNRTRSVKQHSKPAWRSHTPKATRNTNHSTKSHGARKR